MEVGTVYGGYYGAKGYEGVRKDEKRADVGFAGKVAEKGTVSPKDMTLDEYKAYFNEKMNSLYVHPSQKNRNEVIDITDAAELAAAEASAGLVVGALSVSNHLNGIATTPIGAFEETESTIISQNLGNRNLKRAIECFFKGFVLSFLVGIVGWILIRFVFQGALIGLYSQEQDPEHAQEFMNYVRMIHNYDSWSIPSLAINSAVLGLLYGFGKTKITMAINIARAFVFRIPILLILLYCFPELGVECAGLSMGISNVCIALMSIVCLVVFLFQIRKKGYQGMQLESSKGETIIEAADTPEIEEASKLEEIKEDTTS